MKKVVVRYISNFCRCPTHANMAAMYIAMFCHFSFKVFTQETLVSLIHLQSQTVRKHSLILRPKRKCHKNILAKQTMARVVIYTNAIIFTPSPHHILILAASWQNQQNDLCGQPKTQISLGIRPVISESSLSAWGSTGSLATHWCRSWLRFVIVALPGLFYELLWNFLFWQLVQALYKINRPSNFQIIILEWFVGSMTGTIE